MPQAIHESTAFNSRNRKVAIHCVFSVKDNTLTVETNPSILALFFFTNELILTNHELASP